MPGFVRRVRDLAGSVPTLSWVGFIVTTGFLGFAALTIVGYVLTDPGGRTGAGVTALWVLATLALMVLAVYRPRTAIGVLAAAAILPVGFGLWTLLDYTAVMAWEDRTGPVSLVLVLVVGLPAAVAGLSRPLAAGALLLTITLAPWALAVIGAGSDWGRALSIGLVTLPVVVGGLLFVLSAHSSSDRRARLGPPRVAPGH